MYMQLNHQSLNEHILKALFVLICFVEFCIYTITKTSYEYCVPFHALFVNK